MAPVIQPSPCICVNLRRASRAITELYDRALAPSGLKVTQYALLRAVFRAGTVTITDLAERVALDRTTLSRNLAPLQRRGLVRVSSGADKRVRQVSLAPGGQRAMERALPLWQQAQAQVRERLGASGIERLTTILADIQALPPADEAVTDTTSGRQHKRIQRTSPRNSPCNPPRGAPRP